MKRLKVILFLLSVISFVTGLFLPLFKGKQIIGVDAFGHIGLSVLNDFSFNGFMGTLFWSTNIIYFTSVLSFIIVIASKSQLEELAQKAGWIVTFFNITGIISSVLLLLLLSTGLFYEKVTYQYQKVSQVFEYDSSFFFWLTAMILMALTGIPEKRHP